jgi:cytoskeletal protein RodZ
MPAIFLAQSQTRKVIEVKPPGSAVRIELINPYSASFLALIFILLTVWIWSKMRTREKLVPQKEEKPSTPPPPRRELKPVEPTPEFFVVPTVKAAEPEPAEETIDLEPEAPPAETPEPPPDPAEERLKPGRGYSPGFIEEMRKKFGGKPPQD